MGLLDMFGSNNTLKDVVECRNAGGVIIDVRTKGEYNSGHIPGAVNIPINDLEDAKDSIKKKDTPICVYCLSGVRSTAAAKKLENMGYTNVKNLGALKHYRGKIER